MINNEAFTKRLKKVIEYYGETASSFAEKIGVQRSSISHILSGRNKPSLEFVLKVLSYFPEVELYWLMNGKGKFPSEEKSPEEFSKKTELKPLEKNGVQNFSEVENVSSEISDTKQMISNSEKEIDRIIIFYKDGTFSNFKN